MPGFAGSIRAAASAAPDGDGASRVIAVVSRGRLL
jgi:hypothetical protein